LIAKTLWPNEVTGDNAYPLMVLRLLPPGVTGLIVAALLAALMSSLSSVFNSCSTLITIDVYRKLTPEAPERRLVLVGRLSTAAIVVLSIAWIPFIQYLNREIYQYLQSVQAYVGAPITAVFLTGILWRGATGTAAFTTLVAGGLIGATRFLLDILRNALGWDLGPLNSVVAFSFLNFSVIVFLGCVLMMVLISRWSRQPGAEPMEGLTLQTAERGSDKPVEIVFTAVIAATVVALWYHFR
jgi:SSS family solute:Na+ symporter